MAKHKLDLSHTLSPLDNELQDLVNELIALKEKDSPLFDQAINAFIHKYGEMKYQSLDELLESSAAQAACTQKEPLPLSELIKDLTQ